MSRLTARSQIYAAEVGIVELTSNALPVAYSGSITPSASPVSITIDVGLNVLPGDEILIESASGADYVLTRVESYNSGSGALVTVDGGVYGGTNQTSWTVRRAPLRIATVAFSSTSGTYAPASYISGLEEPPKASLSAHSSRADGNRFHGVVVPSSAPLSWVNGGRFDFLRNFTCEGQPVRLFEVPVVRRADGIYVAAPRASWIRIQDGRGLRMTTTIESVTVAVADLTEFLAAPIQRRKWEGLGGCLRSVSSGYASVPNALSLLPAAGDATLALVFSPSATDLAAGAARDLVHWTAARKSGYNFRITSAAALAIGVALDNTGSPLFVEQTVIGAGQMTAGAWYAAIVRWDKASGVFRYSYRQLDGQDSEWIHAEQASTAGLDLFPYSAGTDLRFFDGLSVGSMIADFRAWQSRLEDDDLEFAIRELDLELAEDVADLDHWWTFDERYGTAVGDVIGNLDADLSGSPEWDTSGTGRPEQRGKYRPISFGICWTPMVRVDELADGRIYAVSCRRVNDIVRVTSNGVGMTPTLDFNDTVDFDVARRRISATAPGPFAPFVPAMEFDFVGSSPDGNNDGTYVVDAELTARDRVVVVAMTGPSPVDGSYTGNFTTANPEWEIYRAGTADEPDLIKILTNADGPFHAYVSGDISDNYGATQNLYRILETAIVEHGKPGIGYSQIDTTDIDAQLRLANVGFSVGEEEVKLQEVCEWLMASCAGMLRATPDGSGLVASTIPLDTAVVSADQTLRQVIKLDLAQASIPLSVELAHSPVREPLTDPPGGAWQKVLPQFTKPYQLFSAAMPAWVASRLETAAPSDVIQTVLTGAPALKRLGELLTAGYLAEVYPVEFGTGGADAELGSTVSAIYPRFGFDAGRSGYVVQWERNSGRSRATRLMLAIPRGA